MLSAALPFPAVEDTHAMDEERRDERRSESFDRRENQWTKPAVIIALAQLFLAAVSLLIMIGGGLLVAYVTSQKDSVSSEMTNAQVAAEIQKFSLKLDAIGNMVQQANDKNTTQESAISTLTRDVTEIKSNVADIAKTVEANEKAQRDYNFNLSRDLTRAQEALKR